MYESDSFVKAAAFNHSSLLNTSRFIHKFSGAADSFQNLCIPIPMFHTVKKK